MLIKLLFLVALSLSHSEALKVLGILPFASKSHHNIGSAILKSLTEVGHEVTVLSAFPLKNKEKNYHDIKVTKILEVFETGDAVNPFIFGKYPAIGTLVILSKMNADVVDLFMTDPEVQKFLAVDQKFDVCLFELFFVDALLGIPEKFNCVLMSYTTFATVKWTDDVTGNISPTSYVPNPFYLYADKMTFTERLWNTAFSLAEHAIYHGYHLPKQRKLYQKHFPNAVRTFEEMYLNSSIIFMNTHVSSSTVRPQMPQTVEIAGIHIKPANPLPNDIQDFLDSAKDGVILFSMGSFIQSKMWPIDKREAFVRAFGKLKQKVLWKYENDTLPGNPGNIKIGAWIPQRDILAHKNVKLFITHGGILGTSEALVEAKPILGIPIFGDQRMNMAKAVSKGYGLQIAFDDVTEENVSEALNKLLNDPSYLEMAKKISSQFLDRPMTPKEAVVYYTEYAVRHKGAPHLQGAANRMSFIELHLIDVYSLMALIFVIILIIDYFIIKAIIKRCFRKKEQGKSSSKQKKN